MFAIFKPSGTVTGLYREDYGYNPTSSAFTVYSDVWRERAGQQNGLSNNNDDSYGSRTTHKKKGVS